MAIKENKKATPKVAVKKTTVRGKVAVKKTAVARPAIAPKAVASEKIVQKFAGVVVSDKMTKTIVVKVERVKINSKYHKRFVVTDKYKVHDEKEQYKIGDKVMFVSCRPISKDKKWRVVAE